MTIIKKLVSILLVTLLLLSAASVLSTVAFADETDPTLGNGTTYYVDSQDGKDTNSGTSSSAAWKSLDKVNATTFQPGDNILFKKGGVWVGTLYPKGSGVKGSPITISSYGTGSAMPLIDGNGVHFEQNGSWVDAAVYFCNQSYWTVQNLEVVNDSSVRADRAGIHFDNTTQRTTRYGITIRNNKVHNIASNNDSRVSAINIFSRSWYNAFSDVLIEGNEIYDAKSTGIMVHGHSPSDTVNGAKNIVIRNNVLNRIGGDGILTNQCVAPLVEYNVVNESHNVSVAACVALWPFECTDALFQFNEAYNTKTAYDGQGFDCDYMCTGTTFQYNYSHDNEGGFMLICCEPTNWDGSKVGFNDGSVVRYNISQNDRNNLFSISGNITNTMVYNNTLYTRWGLNTNIISTWSRDGKKYPDNTQFINNLFYTLSPSAYKWESCTNTVWENNLVYGTNSGGAPSDPNGVRANPMLVNAGGAGVGFDSCEAYMLYDNSPAIGAGKVIPNNGGRDFFGNPVSATAAPNIGAYNGPGIPYNVQTTSYAGGYRNLHDWENGRSGENNTKIPFVGGNTTTWNSTASITTDANVLAPNGSTKAVKVHNDKSSAANCALEVLFYKEWLTESAGMRFWLDGNGVSQSVEFAFKGPNSMHYKKSATVPANGGWVEVTWTDSLYKNGPDEWKTVKVTPEIMRNTTAVIITFNNVAAGGDMYVDDIQLKVGAYAATTATTKATTTAAPTAAPTTQAPTQPPVVGEYVAWQNFESYNVGNSKPDCFSYNLQTWGGNTVGVVATDTIGGGAPGSTKAAFVTSTNGFGNSSDGFRVDFLTSKVPSFSQIVGYRIWMKASADGVKARAHIASDLGNNKVARSNKEFTVSTEGAWYEFDYASTYYFNGYGSFGSGNKTVTAEHLAEAKSFGALLAIPAGATVYVDDIQIMYADSEDITQAPATQAPTTAAPTTAAPTTAAPTYNNPYTVTGELISGINNADVSAFKASFNAANGAEVKVFKGTTEVTSGKVGTGMDVVIYGNGTELSRKTIVIYGDVNGDGATSVLDLLSIKTHILQATTLKGAYFEAAKVVKGSNVGVLDLLKLKAVLLQADTITQ